MCAKSQPAQLCGGLMIRISLPYIYELSGTLRLLNGISDGTPIKENLWALVNAENALNGFLSQSVYTTSLRATVLPGHALVQAIKKLTTEPDKERALDFFDSYSLRNSLKEFETVLTAEMNVSDTYFVTKKRGYDTPDLINNAEVLFPQDLLLKVPECRDDIRQAGKCIAFELGTAAGFHIMRANELVLRRYWDVV